MANDGQLWRGHCYTSYTSLDSQVMQDTMAMYWNSSGDYGKTWCEPYSGPYTYPAISNISCWRYNSVNGTSLSAAISSSTLCDSGVVNAPVVEPGFASFVVVAAVFFAAMAGFRTGFRA